MLPILPAFAQDAASDSTPGGLFAQLFPLILIVVIFYFLLIRPQQKRSKEHREMLTTLAVGDEILTNSGVLGKVVKIEENFVLINLGETNIRLQRQAIQSILPAGTIPTDAQSSTSAK